MAFETWVPVKDPNEVKDYGIHWVDALAGDELVTSTWTIESGLGLVIDSSSIVGTDTIVWFSAGNLGQTYEVLNRVTTLGGRTYDKTMKLKMKEL